MRLILQGKFLGFTDIEHQLNVYDLDQSAGGTPIDLILEGGYSLSYNAGISDVMIGGIIESELSFIVHNPGGILNTFLSALTLNGEYRYVVETKKNNTREWLGLLLQDFSNIVDNRYGSIRFSAVDGLSYIKDVEVTDFPEDVGGIGVLGWILDGLRNIPTSEFFDAAGTGTDTQFLFTATNWYGDGMAESEPMHLARFFVQSPVNGNLPIWTKRELKTGYNGQEIETIEYMNYRDVIQHILERFNAVLLFTDGAWHIFQRDFLASEETLNFYAWRKQPVSEVWAANPFQNDKTTFKYIHSDFDRYRSGGSFNYLPGLKSVEVQLVAGDIITGFGAIIPAGGGLEPTLPGQDNILTSFELENNGVNYLHIKIFFGHTFSIPDVSVESETIKGRPNYNMIVKIGTFYLKRNPGPGVLEWVEEPTTILLNGTYIGREGNWFANTSDVWFNRITPPIPANEPLEFQLKLVTMDMTDAPPGVVIPLTPTWFDFGGDGNPQNHCVLYIVDNEQPMSTAKFKVENDTAATYNIEYKLPDSIFGSIGMNANGNSLILPSGEKWSRGFEDEDKFFFNQLLVNEVLANQNKPLLVFSGTIIDRSDSPYNAFQFIRIGYKAAYFKMALNKISYDARMEEWNGEWIEVDRQKGGLVIHPDVEEEPDVNIQPGLSPFNSETNVITTGLVNLVDLSTANLKIPRPAEDAGQSLIYTNKGISILFAEGNIKSLSDELNILESIKTAKFGLLYNYYAITEDDITSNDDWRVPSFEEDSEESEYDWSIAKLKDYLVSEGVVTFVSWGNNTLGKVLKASGTDYWDNNNGTDDVNLNLRGGGYRSGIDGSFDSIKSITIIWTTSENIDLTINSIGIFDTLNSLSIIYTDKSSGASIILVRKALVSEAALADGAEATAYIGNDGKIYKTVKIGEQVWLAEPLAETKYFGGTSINVVVGDSGWTISGDNEIAAMCAYNNDNNNAYD